MEFIITRTSFWDNQKPCREAKNKVFKAEETNINSDYETYVIELNTLEELLDLLKYEDLVIQHSDIVPNMFEIEIYDSFRE